MDYRVFENKVLVRLDPGEEVLESVEQICRKENILLGSLSGLGATADFDTAVYDLGEKKYYSMHCDVQCEITSLFGTISEKDGLPYLHVHMQAMRKDGQAVGGHLKRCVINATCEMVIERMEGYAGRAVAPDTGLTVLSFDE